MFEEILDKLKLALEEVTAASNSKNHAENLAHYLRAKSLQDEARNLLVAYQPSDGLSAMIKATILSRFDEMENQAQYFIRSETECLMFERSIEKTTE